MPGIDDWLFGLAMAGAGAIFVALLIAWAFFVESFATPEKEWIGLTLLFAPFIVIVLVFFAFLSAEVRP
jgi:drug/metabolite transporter superfamily protein YnfA